MQGFAKADDAELPCASMFSVLDVLRLDSGVEKRGNTLRHGFKVLTGDMKAHMDFGRDPETALKKLGAKFSRPRVITALYRERFTGHDTGLDDEEVRGEFPYSSHAILYGYAIAIADGHAALT